MTDPKRINVTATVDSWDDRKPTDFHGTSYDLAKRFLMTEYSHLFRDCISSEEEIADAMHYEKSAGYPANSYGIHTKELLINDPAYQKWFAEFDPDDPCYEPIWMVVPKKEFKEKVDILKNKIRLFQIPPHHLLHHQLKFGKKISERLKLFKWSAYGFNPFEGGFNRLAQRLLSKLWRLSYDVSGWDKYLPIMDELYSLLGLTCEKEWTERQKREFLWVALHTAYPSLRFPTACVYKKPYGNPSGSGTTTRDNILCHIIIMAHALIKAYMQKMGTEPTLSLIAEQVAFLFGDDNIAAVDDEFSLMCDWDFLSAHFASYGMALKFLQGGYNVPLSQLSFLGASFIERDGIYYPHFNTVRLATAMIFDDGVLTPAMYLSKVRTLTTMAYPTSDWPIFARAYAQCLKSMATVQDPVIQSFVSIGPLNPDDLRSFYTGQEAYSTIPESLFFAPLGTLSLTVWRKVGPKFSTTMSMKRTSRGEQILNKLVANPNHPLTQHGKDWLIQVCDPFHDRPFQKTGWPDNNTRPSIVRQVKQSMAISAVTGGGLPLTAPWDVGIAWLPNLVPQVSVPSTSRSNNAVTISSILRAAIGGLTAVMTTSSGSSIDWAPAAGSPNLIGQLSVDSQYLSGDIRLVGVAFEVTDTSAEINKQGMMTICAYPQAGPKDHYCIVPQAGLASTFQMAQILGQRVILPPANIRDAMLLPETRQWDAKYGCLMVPTFQDLGNPATEVSSIVPIFEDQLTTFSPTANTVAPCFVPAFNTSVTTTTTVPAMAITMSVPAYQKIAPTNTCVAYLTGLNPNSTFVVSLIYYIETIPRCNDKGSIVLTQPAPAYDPFALQLYEQIVNLLPPGCMVGDNDSGNWFWDIVEKVSDVAAPLLQMVPHPMAQAGAVLARGANQYAREKSGRVFTGDKSKLRFPPLPTTAPPKLPPRTAANYATTAIPQSIQRGRAGKQKLSLTEKEKLARARMRAKAGRRR